MLFFVTDSQYVPRAPEPSLHFRRYKLTSCELQRAERTVRASAVRVQHRSLIGIPAHGFSSGLKISHAVDCPCCFCFLTKPCFVDAVREAPLHHGRHTRPLSHASSSSLQLLFFLPGSHAHRFSTPTPPSCRRHTRSARLAACDTRILLGVRP